HMGKRLTAKAIENLKPAAVRREISDRANGLFLVVQPSGHKSWAVRCRLDGKPAKLTIGDWPVLTLAAARKSAAAIMHEGAEGHDPRKAKAEAAIKAAAAKANTVAAVCENYLRREGGRLRTFDQRVSTLKRLIYPKIGTRPIGSIKRSEIVTLLDEGEDDHGPRMADGAL